MTALAQLKALVRELMAYDRDCHDRCPECHAEATQFGRAPRHLDECPWRWIREQARGALMTRRERIEEAIKGAGALRSNRGRVISGLATDDPGVVVRAIADRVLAALEEEAGGEPDYAAAAAEYALCLYDGTVTPIAERARLIVDAALRGRGEGTK